MSKPDLIIRPGDWLLALWWAKWPSYGTHTGAQWFACLRRDYVHAEDETANWQLWEHRRCTPDSLGYTWMTMQNRLSVLNAQVFGEMCLRNELAGKAFAHSGSVQILGGGAELLDALKSGEFYLPRWLHVLVIEHGRAREEAGGPA